MSLAFELIVLVLFSLEIDGLGRFSAPDRLILAGVMRIHHQLPHRNSRSLALDYTFAPTSPTARAVRAPAGQVRVRLAGEAAGERVFRGDPQSDHPPPVLEKLSDA